MRGVNKVILVGTLGKDPEVKFLPNGNAVCNFSMATSEAWRDKNSGEMQEATEWHNISMFGKLAEIAGEYLRKGSKAYIEGKLKTRSWDDQATGQKRYKTEVQADQLQMLDNKAADGGGGGQQQAAPAQRQQASAPRQAAAAPKDAMPTRQDQFDDDIPF